MSISRIDCKNTHGYQVRIVRRGKEYSKLFSDRVHGGKDKALAKAQAYEKELLAKLPPLSREKTKPQRNNTSGILGVSRSFMKYRGKGSGGYYWQTTFRSPETGKPMTIKFSVAKYGEEEAKRRAILCRAAKANIFTKSGRIKKKYKHITTKEVVVRKSGKLIRKSPVAVNS